MFEMNILPEEMTEDEDFLELVNLIIPRGPRTLRRYRERINVFDYFNANEFIARYRLSKDVVQMLVDMIFPEIVSRTDWNHALTPIQMVLVTLRFYATGNILQAVVDFHGIHKSTTSRAVTKVSKAICMLRQQFIKMPTSQDEFYEVMTEFYNISSFPKCIGTVDCTHIKIQSPGGPHAETFRNRKQFFSLNIQAISNAKLIIQNIVCRWPGSAHDSTIFNNSNINARFERGDFSEYVILGDSGYAVRQYLLTPLANPRTRGERLYNEAHFRTRNTVERCFGVLKRRFPVLALGIKLKLQNVEAVVVVCAILHNIARTQNIPDPPTNEEMQEAITRTHIEALPVPDVRFNIHSLRRQTLIDQYFSRL